MTALRLRNFAVLLGAASALAVNPSCNIETCEKGAVCDGSGTNEADALELCGEFCARLVTCKTIVSGDREQCESECRTALSEHPRATSDGMSCVIQDACREHYACPGAPLPDHAAGGAGGTAGTAGMAATAGAGGAAGSAGSGGTDAGSGGSAAGSGGAGAVCGTGGPCTPEQACVDGQCRKRCAKSCECAAGESCNTGHCAPDVPPPARCTVDCDCPNGQLCTAGSCA